MLKYNKTVFFPNFIWKKLCRQNSRDSGGLYRSRFGELPRNITLWSFKILLGKSMGGKFLDFRTNPIVY